MSGEAVAITKRHRRKQGFMPQFSRCAIADGLVGAGRLHSQNGGFERHSGTKNCALWRRRSASIKANSRTGYIEAVHLSEKASAGVCKTGSDPGQWQDQIAKRVTLAGIENALRVVGVDQV